MSTECRKIVHYVQSQDVGVPKVFTWCLEVEILTVDGYIGSVSVDTVGSRRCVVVHPTKGVVGHARLVEVHPIGAAQFGLAYLAIVSAPAVVR